MPHSIAVVMLMFNLALRIRLVIRLRSTHMSRLVRVLVSLLVSLLVLVLVFGLVFLLLLVLVFVLVSLLVLVPVFVLVFLLVLVLVVRARVLARVRPCVRARVLARARPGSCPSSRSWSFPGLYSRGCSRLGRYTSKWKGLYYLCIRFKISRFINCRKPNRVKSFPHRCLIQFLKNFLLKNSLVVRYW